MVESREASILRQLVEAVEVPKGKREVSFFAKKISNGEGADFTSVVLRTLVAVGLLGNSKKGRSGEYRLSRTQQKKIEKKLEKARRRKVPRRKVF